MQRALAAVLIVATTACGGETGPIARLHGAEGTTDVVLEIADRPDTRTRGLMYRQSLADGHGMLFVFDEDEDHQFWMKNTYIPLDMIFIGPDRRVVGVHPNATPLSTVSVGVGHPSRYVLEVPGGWAARHRVGAGSQVELIGLPRS